MLHQETENLRQLAKCWNNLDVRFIETILADDFIYKSQWVLSPIEGKKSFLSYLNSKFQAIKTAMKLEPMTITAELALHPAIHNRPCIVLSQISSKRIRQVSLLVKLKQEKIKRIEVCFIPNSAKANLSGEVPL